MPNHLQIHKGAQLLLVSCVLFITLSIEFAVANADDSNAVNKLPDELTSALSFAQENAKSEIGQKYTDSTKLFRITIRSDAEKACHDTSTDQPNSNELSKLQDTTLYYLVLLNRRGSPKSVLYNKKNRYSECAKIFLLKNLTLPPPPFGNYWIKL